MAKNPTSSQAAPDTTTEPYRAKVRMYRQGLGDCLLIQLPRADGTGDFFIMIDCGVILGTPSPQDLMTAVVQDIKKVTNGKVDLLIATHEHWDHLSGFLQAHDEFASGFRVDQVWLSWAENPDDKLAQSLKAEKEQALAALAPAVAHLRLAGAAAADDLESILGFFGAGAGGTTKDALEAVRAFNPNSVRYALPSEAPIEPKELGGVRLFVLGPPRDEAFLKRTNPSKANGEGYGLALGAFNMQLKPVLGASTEDAAELAPFDPIYAIPFDVASEMEFFKTHYWRGAQAGEDWRRIDGAWLDGAEELALQLDNMTNNTSLVLAIELSGGDVLLFAADAQVGNWLSWQDLSWRVDGETVTGPDLLARCIFYKVGHHGSYNATLRTKGLDMMDKLQVAFIPVDHAMAVKKRWGNMPLPEIVTTLQKKTNGSVFLSIGPEEVSYPVNVAATPLYIEARF